MLGAQDTEEVNIQLLLVGMGVWVARAADGFPFLTLPLGGSTPRVGPMGKGAGTCGSEVTAHLGRGL